MVKEENNINEETDYKNNIDDYILTRIPLDDSDLRQYYLDGSNSMIQSLVMELVEELSIVTEMYLVIT